MKKYFKWILLIFLIISLIITGILYFDYVKSSVKNNLSIESEFSKVYNKHWLRYGISIYDNGELVSEDLEIIDTRFMFFTDEYVEYCDNIDVNCKKYNYTYNNGTITIDSEDYFVTKGTYDIVFTKDSIELIRKVDDIEYVYYFTNPK